jgi:hypothetical protein
MSYFGCLGAVVQNTALLSKCLKVFSLLNYSNPIFATRLPLYLCSVPPTTFAIQLQYPICYIRRLRHSHRIWISRPLCIPGSPTATRAPSQKSKNIEIEILQAEVSLLSMLTHKRKDAEKVFKVVLGRRRVVRADDTTGKTPDVTDGWRDGPVPGNKGPMVVACDPILAFDRVPALVCTAFLPSRSSAFFLSFLFFCCCDSSLVTACCLDCLNKHCVLLPSNIPVFERIHRVALNIPINALPQQAIAATSSAQHDVADAIQSHTRIPSIHRALQSRLHRHRNPHHRARLPRRTVFFFTTTAYPNHSIPPLLPSPTHQCPERRPLATKPTARVRQRVCAVLGRWQCVQPAI